jgi:hypothetical protein
MQIELSDLMEIASPDISLPALAAALPESSQFINYDNISSGGAMAGAVANGANRSKKKGQNFTAPVSSRLFSRLGLRHDKRSAKICVDSGVDNHHNHNHNHHHHNHHQTTRAMEPTLFDDDNDDDDNDVVREPPVIMRQRALPPALPFAPFVPPTTLEGNDLDDHEEPPSPPRIGAPKRMILVNLEDVSTGILASSSGGGGGSHRTPQEGSRGNTATSRSQRTGRGSSTSYFTATNHSGSGGCPSSSTEDALTRDAQRVLGGLRRQRETRENKKKESGGGAFGTPNRNKKTRGIGAGHSKKNGVDEFEMLGAVLMIPTGSEHDRDAAAGPTTHITSNNHNTSSSGISSPPRSPTAAMSTPVGHRQTEGGPCSLTYSSSPPTLSPPPLRRPKAAPSRRLLRTLSPTPSPPTLQQSCRKWTPEVTETLGITSVSPPSSPSSPSLLQGRDGTSTAARGNKCPRKAPFVAPPPLMEDWSDDDDGEGKERGDGHESGSGSGSGSDKNNEGVVMAIDKEDEDADADADADGRSCFSMTVLRDYRTLVRGDRRDGGGYDDEGWCTALNLPNNTNNKAEQQIRSGAGTGTVELSLSLASWAGPANERTGQEAPPADQPSAGAVDAHAPAAIRSRFGVRSRGSLLGGDDDDDDDDEEEDEGEEAKEEEIATCLYPLTSLLLHASSSSGSGVPARAVGVGGGVAAGFSTSGSSVGMSGCLSPPYTFPSSKSLELQFQQRDITVAPGVKLPLRGAQETMAALRRLSGDCRHGSSSSKRRSDFATTQCWTCEAYLCCLRDAEYVLCPRCRVISPLDVVQSASHEGEDGAEEGNAARSGVALGFTDTEWLQWRQQVSLYDD